jgi:hypothetical protein
VEVISGDGYNKPYGRFCGKILPDSITSESNSLQIKFNSDDSVQNAGFQAKYFIGIIRPFSLYDLLLSLEMFFIQVVTT